MSKYINRTLFIRPFNHNEQQRNEASCLEVAPDEQNTASQNQVVSIESPHTGHIDQYEFYSCYWLAEDKSPITVDLGDYSLANVNRMYSTSILLYGGGSTGKSYILLGSSEHRGLLLTMVDALFSIDDKKLHTKVFISVFEVDDVQSQLFDLLPEYSEWQDMNVDLTFQRIKTRKSAISLIEKALERRHSETHTFINFTISQKVNGVKMYCTVDITLLANVKDSDVQDLRPSFRALHQVIGGIEQGLDTSEIPFDSCLLTTLLKDPYMSGKLRVILLTTVGPASSSYDLSYSVLNFGAGLPLDRVKPHKKLEKNVNRYADDVIENQIEGKVDNIMEDNVERIAANTMEESQSNTSEEKDINNALETIKVPKGTKFDDEEIALLYQCLFKFTQIFEDMDNNVYPNGCKTGITTYTPAFSKSSKKRCVELRKCINLQNNFVESKKSAKPVQPQSTQGKKSEKASQPKKKKKSKKKNKLKSGKGRRTATVLLVEDVKVSQKIAKAALRRAQLKSLTADNGEAAVELYKKHAKTLELVLMDIHMPGIDGMEATQRIRTWEQENDIDPCTILGLTGNVSEGNMKDYELAGMNGCILKGNLLVAAIKKAQQLLDENPDIFADTSGIGDKKGVKEPIIVDINDEKVDKRKHARQKSFSSLSLEIEIEQKSPPPNVESMEMDEESNEEDESGPPVMRRKKSVLNQDHFDNFAGDKTELATTTDVPVIKKTAYKISGDHAPSIGTPKAHGQLRRLVGRKGEDDEDMDPERELAGEGSNQIPIPDDSVWRRNSNNEARAPGNAWTQSNSPPRRIPKERAPFSFNECKDQYEEMLRTPKAEKNTRTIVKKKEEPTRPKPSILRDIKTEMPPEEKQASKRPSMPKRNSRPTMPISSFVHAEPGDKKKKRTRKKKKRGKSRAPPNILIAEDVKVSLKIAEASLRRAHHRVVSAENGKIAVEKYQKHYKSLKVVIMDIHMPLMDGMQATEQIRNFEDDNDIEPVLILGLTGNVSEDNIKEYDECGMNGCIVKGKLLAEAVKEAIRQCEENPEDFINLVKR